MDPASRRDEIADVLIESGKIAEVAPGIRGKADRVIDASGKIVCPGLIDMHVHLREPGLDEAETIASGAAAAVAGGFTTVAAMPNTAPPVDNVPSVEYVGLAARRAGLARVYAIGTLSKGRRGLELAELAAMSRAGAVGFSDDGDPVANSNLMRRAMEYAKMLAKPVISHCEDKSLSGVGVMHEGTVSARLGLPGIPAASEVVAVSRDVALAEMTGAHLHVAHVSTAAAVDVIRRARARGVRVTAEATAHHLTLTDACLLERDAQGILRFDTNYKMNPPLRTREDVEALRQGLRDGTIDCIVSDHAPHSSSRKELEFVDAPFGIIGLETTLPIVITELVLKPGRPGEVLSWMDALAALTANPARILGTGGGTLAVGAAADVTVIDPDCEWTIDVGRFRSRSANSPLHGKKVKGKAAYVVVGGELKT